MYIYVTLLFLEKIRKYILQGDKLQVALECLIDIYSTDCDEEIHGRRQTAMAIEAEEKDRARRMERQID